MASEKVWVDFKAVKQAAEFAALLEHYQINWLRKSGKELRGRCPFEDCKHQDAFHVNVSKNAFQCFHCKRAGNVIDFVSQMEPCAFRDAALKLQEWFPGVGDPAAEYGDTKSSGPATSMTVRNSPASKPETEQGSEAAINKPLTFQLRGINPEHPYLASRGIDRELAAQFECGYFSGRGTMTGRVVIPVHNERGELVAYAGRSIDGSEPKYKLPAGFYKSQVLFNLHRVIGQSREVVVVEGFFDCMKVTAAGFACVALMGSSLSEEQELLVVENFQAAVLLLDGDDAGHKGTEECLVRLGRRMWVTALTVPEGKQPDQMTAGELRVLLGK